MSKNQRLYAIGAVERDTGIGRDTLRIWERRYGFPVPLRNPKGERLYPEKQVRRLQRIRRLLDQGVRPGKLLPLDENDLDKLEASVLSPITQLDEDVDELLDAIQTSNTTKIRELLVLKLQIQGMQDFVLKTMTPLLTAIGDYWASGKLLVYQEHYMTEQLILFLSGEISKLQIDSHSQNVQILLTTLPGEQHSLGLLMIAALCAAEGIAAINLGTEVPMDQIAAAINQFRPRHVGITFSGSYHYKNIRANLLELRKLTPADVDILVGGEGVRRLRKLPSGITKHQSLHDLPMFNDKK